MAEVIEKIRIKLISRLLILLHFGFKRAKRTASLGVFKEEVISTWVPIFVLSTGRSGTAWLSEFFRKIDSTWVAHSYAPEFIGQGRLAYELMTRRGDDADILHALGQMYLAGREDVMVRCYERSLQFIETNNRITFLCWALAKIFPNAKFIHLTRDPIDFIRSGISRGWYESADPHDHGRLRPLEGSSDADLWYMWDQAQKIAWLWKETNSFIMDFARSEFRERIFAVRFEDLLGDRMVQEKLVQFCGLSFPKATLSQDKVINQQKHRDVSSLYMAAEEGKKKIRAIVAEVAEELGYM